MESTASKSTGKGSLIAGVTAAVLASVCCVGPLLLLGLGVSGAWIGSLAAFEPFRPYMIAATLIFLALAFRKLYLVPQNCEPGTMCATPQTLRKQRILFWVITLSLIVLMAFPWYAPFIL